MSTSKEKTDLGAWSFYVAFILSLIFEGSLIHFLGFWLGGAAILFGGMAWGLLALAFTDPATKAPDPFFKVSVFLLRKWPRVGYIPMVLLAGSPGTAVAYKKLQHPRAKELTVIAAVIFAVVWVPIFHYIWR